MDIIERLKEQAAVLNARIVLPEGDDARVREAAEQLAAAGLVRPILLTSDLSLMPDGIEAIVPAQDGRFDEMAQAYFALRQHKGITLEQARAAMAQPVTFGAMLVRMGAADGCVAGAAHATGDVLRAGFQIIGLADDVSTVSSAFLMILPDGRTITYGDCAVVPNPTAEQLATIAASTAHTHEQLTGEPARVAMLSFSTKGSAKHPDVDKVREATALAQAADPDLLIDGELQFDAAWIEAIGQRKAPGSSVAGRANVFVFPTLDAGNIGYKLTERLGNAQAIGPIIQGLARPMHDLSRGCKAADIVVLSLIAAIQARG